MLWETVAAVEHRRWGKVEGKCKISLFELKENNVRISKLQVPDWHTSEKESCKLCLLSFIPWKDISQHRSLESWLDWVCGKGMWEILITGPFWRDLGWLHSPTQQEVSPMVLSSAMGFSLRQLDRPWKMMWFEQGELRGHPQNISFCFSCLQYLFFPFSSLYVRAFLAIPDKSSCG